MFHRDRASSLFNLVYLVPVVFDHAVSEIRLKLDGNSWWRLCFLSNATLMSRIRAKAAAQFGNHLNQKRLADEIVSFLSLYVESALRRLWRLQEQLRL